ncbi:methionine ABC transporter ATP-binding protein [Vagococcus acidifermentans]|uniref:ABC transporter domain-containing protein n=2 Tax=Vagococcus acidifermentans TaxID=564710 RepID=A0A430AQJ7_9ENTE|nr:hypothetical protein CBF27_10305 [Vagococcus acidifermentans]
MIILEHVSKCYVTDNQSKPALKNVNLQIEQGELFGIVGESGSGKSTLLKLLIGLETPDTGHIVIDGTDQNELSRQEKLARTRAMSMVFQQFNLLYNRTVYDNTALPLTLQGKTDDHQVMSLLRFVGLADKAAAYPKQLSGGQKQRVAIARALVTNPSYLLCDEPTSALDLNGKDDVIRLLKTVHRKFRPTIILVSHELAVIKKLCTRAAIFDQGTLTDVIALPEVSGERSFDSYAERAKEVLLS